MYGGGIVSRNATCSFINCTISGNHSDEEGGGICCCQGITTMKDCILWNDESMVSGNEIALTADFGASTLSISYSNVQGGYESAYVESGCTLDWGPGMMDEDPLFTAGPEGDYYLSQIAAGQEIDSPCVDAGSGPAHNSCFGALNGEICLDSLWTRTDEIADSGIVDMGYHYPLIIPDSAVTPTPAPVPSVGDSGLLLLVFLCSVVLVWGTKQRLCRGQAEFF